jgi:hypothetical protein
VLDGVGRDAGQLADLPERQGASAGTGAP